MYTKKQDYSYFLYWTNSGTQLLLPFMSHKKLTVLTGWQYYSILEIM